MLKLFTDLNTFETLFTPCLINKCYVYIFTGVGGNIIATQGCVESKRSLLKGFVHSGFEFSNSDVINFNLMSKISYKPEK